MPALPSPNTLSIRKRRQATLAIACLNLNLSHLVWGASEARVCLARGLATLLQAIFSVFNA